MTSQAEGQDRTLDKTITCKNKIRQVSMA